MTGDTFFATERYLNRTIKTKSISRNSTGELVAAVTGKKIRVLGYTLTPASAVTVRFDSATTAITGAMTTAAGVPIHGNSGPFQFETAAGEALNVTLGSGVQISGHLTYIEAED